jgi:hypothetical protein
MSFITDGTLGVKVDRTDTSAAFSVGIQKPGNEGSKWMYVQADASIGQYAAVMINQSSKAVPLTTTNSASSKAVGFAQVSVASGSYSWVALEGNNIKVNLATDCAPNVRLYTTATNGVLDDAIVSAGLIQGVIATVTISNATAVRIIAHNPHISNQSTT